MAGSVSSHPTTLFHSEYVWTEVRLSSVTIAKLKRVIFMNSFIVSYNNRIVPDTIV